ncbi:MAG: DUF2059 domain-containing protein [Sulfitobacter sp.]
MMRRFGFAAAFALLSLPVSAQDTNVLAQEYVNMPEVQNMITEMFSARSMGAQVKASLPPNVTIADEQEQKIGELMSAAMAEIRPKMQDLMVTSSAEIFTAPELEALIAFYQSEHGAAIMSKTQPMFARIMATLAPDMQALQTRVGPELLKILQEE